MKLEYLKLNETTYTFKNKINLFLGEKNSGKTTLYHLIKFIYGAEYKRNTVLYKAFNSIRNIYDDYMIEWRFNGSSIVYSLNLTSKKIHISTNEELSLSIYSQYIINKYKYSAEVFGKNIKKIECFSYDEDITKKLNSANDYAKFLCPYNDMSYTAICFLKLVNRDYLADNLQDYFMLYGKKKNIEKIKAASKSIKDDFNSELIDALEEPNNQRSNIERYVELSKINHSNIDDVIFKELTEICKGLNGFDIEKVKRFHDDLVDSYNEVIEKERNYLTEKNDLLDKYSKDELSEAISYYNLFDEMKNEVDRLKPSLLESSKGLESLESDIKKINEELKSFCEKFNSDFKLLKQFNNMLEYRESKGEKTNVVLNLQNKTHNDAESGGSDTLINFIGFLIYSLSNSNFPLLLFEKSFIIENQNATIIELLNKIANIFDNTKYLIATLHPDDELVKIKSDNCSINIFECNENFFNISF